MRIAACLACLLLLSGCDALIRHDGDYFEAAGTDSERFEMDSQACGVLADKHVTYDLQGAGGTSYDRNRTYNAYYGRCMTGRGYAARAYAENWLP